MKYSPSEENYLKAIYHLQQESEMVNTNSLARSLQTTPASVTDMLKKLQAKDLLDYEKYQGVKLNSQGRQVAIHIVRRHRLWEYFLVEKLKFGWDEVHEIAEELEHIRDLRLIDRLDAYLGHPRTDPHGDPIPDSEGRIAIIEQVCLTEVPENKIVQVSSVGDQSTELLDLLTHNHIGIGTSLSITRRFAFDHSMEISIDGLPLFTVSEQLAKNLFVTYE